MNARRSYALLKSNEQIFIINCLYLSQVNERKKFSEHVKN